MKIYKFTVVFEPEKGQKGVYNAFVPALPGCLSFGESLIEARYNIREAIELYLSTLLEEDELIPKDKKIKTSKNAEVEEIIVGIDYEIKAGFEKKLLSGYAK
ncbi:MAG: type II toxin-antitoxin system HicB family antitoxin [Candidatus Nealsonbacteria bacterium]